MLQLLGRRACVWEAGGALHDYGRGKLRGKRGERRGRADVAFVRTSGR